MKTGPDAHGTAQNESESAKHENRTRRPWYRPKRVLEPKTLKQDPAPTVPPKMSPGAQHMKMRPNALGTVQNESGSIKHETGTRGPRYCPKRVLECKT
jgi:hypothetical protein